VEVPGAGVTAAVAPVSPSQRPQRTLRAGTDLELGIIPEAVTVLPTGTRIHTSARNLWRARVVEVLRPARFGVQILRIEVGERTLAVTVTASAVKDLRLKAGSEVVVQLKATALRLRIPVREPRP
jgi:molybdopterin-binding protein